MKSNIIDFRAVNDRICPLSIKPKYFNLPFINAHAPTEDKEDDVKEEF